MAALRLPLPPLPALRFSIWIALLIAGASGRLQAQIVEVRRPFKVETVGGRETVQPKTKLSDSDRACRLDGSELADRAFVELLNGGQLQTSAEVLRLCIGEGKVTLPLYLVLGSNASGVSDPSAEERSLASLIAPTGGTFNLQVTNAHELHAWGALTDLSFSYQAGLRYARLPIAGTSEESEPVVAGDFAAGLRFQTPAWEAGGKATDGVFWIQAQLGARLASKDKLQQVFGPEADKPTMFSVEAGIEIEGLVTLKASWSKVLNNENTPGLKSDLLKIAFDLKRQKTKTQ